MAHLEVAAGPGGVLAGAVGAADLLDLLAQALQGAVHLQVAVAEDVGVVGAVHAVGIGGLLLWLGDEAQVESAAGGAGGTGGSGKSGRTLCEGGMKGLIDGIRSVAEKRVNGRPAKLTAGPISPERPRGPGGPVGPGRPVIPSLPAAPALPLGP